MLRHPRPRYIGVIHYLIINHLEVCCFLSFDLQSFATHGGIMACQKLGLAPGIEVHYGGSIMAQWRIRKVTLAGYQNN
jgi:hypothetical protein